MNYFSTKTILLVMAAYLFCLLIGVCIGYTAKTLESGKTRLFPSVNGAN